MADVRRSAFEPAGLEAGDNRSVGHLAWLYVSVGILGAAAAILAALLVTNPLGIVISVGIVAIAAFFAVGGRLGEKVLASYWVAFCVFSTILASSVISGMFILFYLAFLGAAIAYLVRGRLTIDVPSAWALAGLFLIVFASLAGFTGSLGGVVLDRLLFLPIGFLAMVIMTSTRKSSLVFGAMLLSSVAVAVWVIVTAADAQFAYRGSLALDQNVLSYYIGVGFTIGFAWLVTLESASREYLRVIVATLILGVLGYAMVILASRGAIISLGIVALVALAQAIATRPRRVWRIGVLLLVVSSGLLLPGGEGILQRFEDPSTATGGGRVAIWETVIAELQGSTVTELVLGHGMAASGKLISNTFAYLSSTHSSILLALYDYGVVGAVLFLALHLMIFLRVWRHGGGLGVRVLLLLVFQMAIGLFITASDNYLYWIALGTMFGVTAIRPTSPTVYNAAQGSGGGAS